MPRLTTFSGSLPVAVLVLALMASLAAVGCIDSSGPRATATVVASAQSHIVEDPEQGRAALRCEDCEPVTVIEVLNADTVLTVRGRFRLYGAFIAPESELCVAEATARLTELAGSVVRIEEGARLLDGQGEPLRYLYTEAGDSIDELLIREGSARLSAYDGQHMPWLLFRADEARIGRRGCIWEEYNQLFGKDS
jgi:endonuclease YncB( thermonuclease family)